MECFSWTSARWTEEEALLAEKALQQAEAEQKAQVEKGLCTEVSFPLKRRAGEAFQALTKSSSWLSSMSPARTPDAVVAKAKQIRRSVGAVSVLAKKLDFEDSSAGPEVEDKDRASSVSMPSELAGVSVQDFCTMPVLVYEVMRKYDCSDATLLTWRTPETFSIELPAFLTKLHTALQMCFRAEVDCNGETPEVILSAKHGSLEVKAAFAGHLLPNLVRKAAAVIGSVVGSATQASAQCEYFQIGDEDEAGDSSSTVYFNIDSASRRRPRKYQKWYTIALPTRRM